MVPNSSAHCRRPSIFSEIYCLAALLVRCPSTCETVVIGTPWVTMSAIFTAHPDVKKWMSMRANEEGAVGATRALEQAGLDKDFCIRHGQKNNKLVL